MGSTRKCGYSSKKVHVLGEQTIKFNLGLLSQTIQNMLTRSCPPKTGLLSQTDHFLNIFPGNYLMESTIGQTYRI